MYKHDLPHLFRLLLLFLVIVLGIVDFVGAWWYQPANLLDRFFLFQYSDWRGTFVLCASVGVGWLVMTVKEKHDWRWLTWKFAYGQEERELHIRADRGNSKAQYDLGVLYELPFGCGMQDIAQAAFWYRMAADQGNTEAHERLAHMYDENGNRYYDQSPSAKSQH